MQQPEFALERISGVKYIFRQRLADVIFKVTRGADAIESVKCPCRLVARTRKGVGRVLLWKCEPNVPKIRHPREGGIRGHSHPGNTENDGLIRCILGQDSIRCTFRQGGF